MDIAQSIFKILRSSFCKQSPILQYKIGVIGGHGGHFWKALLFKGLKGGYPRKKHFNISNCQGVSSYFVCSKSNANSKSC